MAHDDIPSLADHAALHEPTDKAVKRMEELGRKIIDQFSEHDLRDPRLCALAAGLAGIYLLSISKASQRDQDQYFTILKSEYMSVAQWLDPSTDAGVAFAERSNKMN